MRKKIIGIQMTHSIWRKDKKPISSKERAIFHKEFIKNVEKRGWLCGGGMGLTDLNDMKESEWVTVFPKHIVEKI